MKILNANPKEIVWDIRQVNIGEDRTIAEGKVGNLKFLITVLDGWLILSIILLNPDNIVYEGEFFNRAYNMDYFSVVDVMKVAKEKFNELWFQLSECTFVNVTKEMQEEIV